MKESVWFSRLLSIGGVLEVLVGLGLLAIPSVIASVLLGAPLTGVGPVVARLAGGALLALGVSCWFASAAPTSRMGNGVAGAFLLYNIVACATLAMVRPLPPNSLLLLGASALHGLLAAGLLVALFLRARVLMRMRPAAERVR